jgi:hypothetical protein
MIPRYETNNGAAPPHAILSITLLPPHLLKAGVHKFSEDLEATSKF